MVDVVIIVVLTFDLNVFLSVRNFVAFVVVMSDGSKLYRECRIKKLIITVTSKIVDAVVAVGFSSSFQSKCIHANIIKFNIYSTS